MRGVVENGQARGAQRMFRQRRHLLMTGAFGLRLLQMPYRRAGGGRDHRRQRRREDEGWRIAAHRIHDGRAGGDIAAQRPETFGQRALDHVDAPHQAFALADAAATRPIHADRVHFIDICHRVIFFGKFDDRAYRGYVAVHRIEALEDDQLGARRASCRQQTLQIGNVVMAPDLLLAARPCDALDHGIMIEGIRQDQTVGQQFCDGGNAREVGYPARREDERRRFAMQVGQLFLKLHDGMMRA